MSAGRHEHHRGRAGAVVVVASPDARRMSEGHGVVQVHRLALGLSCVVLVDEHDLGREAAQEQRIPKRGADVSQADYGYT